METPSARDWLAAHPYLAPAAELYERIRGAARPPRIPSVAPPRFEAYARDYAAGVPLLRSDASGIDVVALTAQAVEGLLRELQGAPLPAALEEACRELRQLFTRSTGERDAAIRYALDWGDDTPAPSHAGVLRFLSWNGLAAALAPVLREFDAWRRDEDWRRPYCPTCGAHPSMARLVAASDGRRRVLSCACCATRWGWQRIGCPFCGNEAPARLECVEVGGEPFRLDACRECHGYTKTWTGEGDESLFLAEWPTLHLDALANERGLRRAGDSLFDL